MIDDEDEDEDSDVDDDDDEYDQNYHSNVLMAILITVKITITMMMTTVNGITIAVIIVNDGIKCTNGFKNTRTSTNNQRNTGLRIGHPKYSFTTSYTALIIMTFTLEFVVSANEV